MSAQMSTAMMSAPSCASRTAWLRPWPRAAPVTKATLPSMRPAMGSAPPVSSAAGGGGGDALGDRARGQPALAGGEGRRDALPALVDPLARVAPEAGHVDDVVRHPLEDLLEHLLGHPLAQVRAGAAVDPDAEGQVPVRPAVDVDLVGVVELVLVPIGRRPGQQRPVAHRDRAAVELRVLE